MIKLSSEKGVLKNKKSKKPMSLAWRSTWQLSILSLPAFVWFIVFCYIPMFGSIIAFKDFNYQKGIFGSEWNGLNNFAYLFQSNDALRILKNTVGYNLVFIALGIILGVTIALMLEQVKNRNMVKLYQAVLFLPYFISWVAVAFISQGLFKFEGGIINNIIKSFGGEASQWYTNPAPWPLILTISNLWKSLGFSVLLYYGGLLGIDTSLYEAANLDGASTMQRIFKITLPMLRPVIIVLFIMSVGNIMRADFGLFYYVPNNYGPLYSMTDVLDTYIYRALKVSGDIPGSSAASFFQSIVGFIVVLIVNGITRKVDPDNALF